ncbi:OmpP1/FadL family transporter [Hydrocarboniclastica marina]|nr:outer membrane protein transport protein [Hydrocarboniclastica marina]
MTLFASAREGKNDMWNKTVRLGCFFALALTTFAANAQLVQNALIHPKALALGNAVTADPPGMMSIHYNPAGLTRLDDRQLEVNFMNIYLDIDADFIAPEGYEIFGIDGVENDPIANSHSHTNTVAVYIPGFGLQKLPVPIAAVPSGGFSVREPGSKFTFANAFYIPFAAGYHRSNSDPGKYYPRATAIQRVTYLSPSVGYRINDEWSVGAGIHLSHFGLAVDQSMRAPNLLLGMAEVLQDAFSCESGDEPLSPWLTLCGGNVGPFDDIGVLNLDLQETISPTYALGVTWEPTPWFAWGAAYTSAADMKLKGKFEIEYTDDWSGFWQRFNGSVLGAITSAILSLPSGAPEERGNVSADFTYPQHFQTGISMDLHPLLSVNFDVGWTDYSAWDALDLEFDRTLEFLNAARILSPDNATGNTLKFPLGMQDVWNWGIGTELHASTRLDLRAGIEVRDSVIPSGSRTTMAPFGDVLMYNVGFGYRWDKDTMVDASLSYLHSVEYIPADTSCALNCDNITNIIYNPYAGMDVKTSLRLALAGISFRTKF